MHADPEDPRIDDIGGDLTPEWGLHLVDANLAMGDLATITESQARAYQSSHQSPEIDNGCAITVQRRPSGAAGLLFGGLLLLICRRSRTR